MKIAGVILLLATLGGARVHPRPTQTPHTTRVGAAVGNSSGLTTGQVGAAVNTSSGLITGHAARNRSSVFEYLGIPYAQPPVGQLRFAAPQKYSSNKPLIAASYSPDCHANPAKPVHFPNATAQEQRIVSLFAGQAGNQQSEDCLTLNIWTKASGKQNKPVLLWLYGGRFNIGDTNTPFYQGQYLADAEDVVIVTVNYRVNIFGFPGYSQLPKNPGLLDQRMAVEWVRDNIVGFGGSPAKITLVGQSAGGVSVDYYSYIWKSDPIVHGLILQSGTALSFDPNTAALSEASFYNASMLLGCGSSGDVLPCFRNKSSTEVLAAIAKIPPQPSAALPAPIFQPTIDEETIFSNYSGLSSTHAFSPIPYLAGNNDNEYGYYAIAASALNQTFSGAQIDLFNLGGFTCPTAAETAARSAAGIPTWRYRYFGAWPNLQLYPNSGAYHGSEINMVFGTAQDVSGLPSTDEENQLSAYMMAAWAAFAGDPVEGLSTRLGWPTYNSSAATLVGLGYANETQAIFVDPGIWDQPCQFLGDDKVDSEGAFR